MKQWKLPSVYRVSRKRTSSFHKRMKSQNQVIEKCEGWQTKLLACSRKPSQGKLLNKWNWLTVLPPVELTYNINDAFRMIYYQGEQGSCCLSRKSSPSGQILFFQHDRCAYVLPLADTGKLLLCKKQNQSRTAGGGGQSTKSIGIVILNQNLGTQYAKQCFCPCNFDGRHNRSNRSMKPTSGIFTRRESDEVWKIGFQVQIIIWC